MTRRRARGFTLVELLVAVGVASLLLTITVSWAGTAIRTSRERALPEKLVQDFAWARGAAGVADAAALNPAWSGVPVVRLVLTADCTWTVSVNGNVDSARSMTAAQLAGVGSGISCTAPTLPATFVFTPTGTVTPTGNVTITVQTRQWPLRVLGSGSLVRTQVAS